MGKARAGSEAVTEFYTVMKSENGWTVLNELNIPVRSSPRRDLMERYAIDPQWRLYLAQQSMKAEKLRQT